MKYRKLKLMAILLISFNIVSPIITDAQELIETKSESNDSPITIDENSNGSKVDETTNVDSKVDETTNVDNKVDETTNVDNKVDETTNVDSKVDETTNVDSKVEETTNVDSKVDETTNVDNKVDETTNVDSKVDETTNVDSKVEETTNVDSKVEETTNVENKEKHYASGVGKSNPTDIVNIPDIQFKRSLNQSLNVKDKDSDITVAQMETLTSYSETNNKGIKDITGIEYAVNIEEFVLQDNQVVDISPLAGLSNLWKFSMRENKISDMTPLAGMTQITSLDLSTNPLSDISTISTLTNVKNINFKNCSIDDIGALSGLTHLNHVTLNNNYISDITALSGKKEMTELDISDNTISDLSPIADASMLVKLYVNNNQISDISALSTMNSLQTFEANNNQISDLSPIKPLTKLDMLKLSGNKISDLSTMGTMNRNITALNQVIEFDAGMIYDAADWKYSVIKENGTEVRVTFTEKNPEKGKHVAHGIWNTPTIYGGGFSGTVDYTYEYKAGEDPVINGAHDLTVLANKTPDYLDGVTANDKEDGDLTSAIIVDDSMVNLTKVGDYNLTYSVTDSDANVTTVKVVVHVLSNEKPIISGTKDLSVLANTSIDYLNGITASDVEDGDLTSAIIVDDSKVDLTTPGDYELIYSVTDTDGNTVIKKVTVHVLSNEHPEINGTKDLSVLANTTIDYLDGVSATDKEDGDLTSAIIVDDSKVDLTKVGSYDLTYSVTDSDGNTTTKTITVDVLSNEHPEINGTKDLSVLANTTIDYLDGVSATDKEDGDLTSAIIVDDSKVDLTKVGSYDVTYSVTDSDGNTTTKTVIVDVLSNEHPEINGTNDITIKLGEKADFVTGVSASDKEDGDLTSTIVVDDSKVDYNKTGDYNVTYSVTDKDGNTTTKIITLTIERDLTISVTPPPSGVGVLPVIDGTKDLSVLANTTIDYLDGVSASDADDGDLTSMIIVDDSKVDLTTVGDYELIYSVTDTDGNTVIKKVTVHVLSNEHPEINGTKDLSVLANTTINYLDGVSANDKEDGDLTSAIVVDDSKVDLTKVGSYDLTYSVTDSDGNTTTKTITVDVLSNEHPEINGTKDLSVLANTTIDYLDGVSANDKEDGDLTSSIIVDDSKVDLTKVGSYGVTYSVTDSDGNTTTKTIIVDVLSNEHPEINGTNDITIKLGEKADFVTGVSANDKEDGDLTSKIIIDDSKVDYNKTGDYDVTYSVTDKDGNTTTKIITLTIERDVTIPVTPPPSGVGVLPVIDGTKDLSVLANTTIDYLDGVSASDADDGDLTSMIIVDDSKVDLTTVGDYELIYSVTDSDGNTVTKKVTVHVLANEHPEINGTKDIEIKLGESADYLTGVSASDKEDGDLTSIMTVDDSKVDYDKTGTYNVEYSVTDKDGNTTTKTITLTIERDVTIPVTPPPSGIGVLPVIDGTKDLSVLANTTIDYLDGVSASDADDGDLTSMIIVDDSKVDLTTPGDYELIYLVTDSDGNTITKKIIVHVLSNERPEFNGADDITINLGESADYLTGVSATDKEDGDLTSIMTVDDSKVDYNKSGDYEVVYSVTDSDGNTTTKVIKVTIKRNLIMPIIPETPEIGSLPIINGTTNIVADVNTSIDYLKGVSAYDAEDGDLTSDIKVDDSGVNYSKSGMYKVGYSVMDSDGNTNEKTIIVELIDEVDLININPADSISNQSTNDNNNKLGDSSNIIEKSSNNTEEKKLANTAVMLKINLLVILIISLLISIIIRQRYYNE